MHFIKYFLISFLVFGYTSAIAQSQEKAISLLILNFAKNIQWPKYTSENSFTIGVFNYSPLMSELQKSIAHQRVGRRKIILKDISYPDEAKGCDLLFIPSFKSKSILKVRTVIGEYPTLLVTNTFHNNSLGSNINIILKDGKLTYEIYKPATDSKQLKIPAAIKNMGIVINQ